MRLVGASTLYIALPFLLEALVTAADRRGPRGGRARRRSCTSASSSGCGDLVGFIPGSGWDELSWLAVLVIAILGPVLTLIPTLLLTRKYIKV